ncbi:hypothetical protein MMF93_02165 [Streptomyces tubbatahanensis]|uniref:Cytochrome C oxidase subunit I n=1 Tax=Streptomyces tubbatahanensis TaxID=2923272 RepID=A0ABY3XLY2_9ACTN|nr:hypothetical protein [Streptomyces tubbatahanensis]UNS95404.1 hypothetical protein MMF93_02165 [Streptomyces tubbatahanensis]
MRATAPTARQTAADINRIEGYLLLQAERDEAQAQAEAFAARMPWLTAGQRDEVVRLYTADRMALTRRVLHGLTERCAELREEYTARYLQLRRRVLARATFALLLGVALVTGACFLDGLP